MLFGWRDTTEGQYGRRWMNEKFKLKFDKKYLSEASLWTCDNGICYLQ